MSTQTFAHQKIEHIRSMNASPSPLQSALARCKVDPRKSGMYEVQLERAADRYHYDMDLEDRRAELGARVPSERHWALIRASVTFWTNMRAYGSLFQWVDRQIALSPERGQRVPRNNSIT